MRNSTNVEQSRDIWQALREDSRRSIARRLAKTFFPIFVSAVILNFVMFLAGAFYFGGDAWNGKAEGNKYYLWGYHNGTKDYIQVSQRVFDYSRWHVYSVMVTWPVMLVVCFAEKRLSRYSED